ncbi:MAG: hypothetical protein Q4D98_09990 [Planctomycetia bacterium]|nr:hypothetical protein [Planctomycetia bacterium]
MLPDSVGVNLPYFTKKPVYDFSQTGRVAGAGFEPYQENPIKHGISENPETAGGLNGGYLNNETVKRGILELFLSLDSGSQKEVVDVLGRLVGQAAQMAGKGIEQ